MSDWQPGDLALCVNDSPLDCGHVLHDAAFSARKGTKIEVEGVDTVQRLTGYPECDCEVLIFSAGSGLAQRFVKITPGHEVEGSGVEREKFKQGNPWKVPA